MLKLEVWPEWFAYKKERPQITIFVEGTERLDALLAQSTSLRYEVVVVNPPDLDELEGLRNPIVRWVVGQDFLHTARGEAVLLLPPGLVPLPNMIEDLGILLKTRCKRAYGLVEYPKVVRRNAKFFLERMDGEGEILVDRVVARKT